MLKSMARIYCLIAALGITTQVHAEQPPFAEVIKQLNSLLKAKDYIAAYQYGDAQTFEFGGDPEFDLLVGLAAYGAEKYQEGVFAFERVLLAKPGSYLARYYLASSYLKVDNLHAAAAELERLLTRPITQVQREKAEALHNRVERILVNRNLTWYQQVSSSIAFDNNVNSGTDKDTITLPNIGEIQLFENSKSTRDLSYAVNYMAGYQHPISQYQWLKIDVSASYFGYMQQTQYQRFQAGFNLAYEQELLRGKVSVAGYSRPLWREVEQATSIEDLTGNIEKEIGPYRTENGVSLFFQKNTSRKTSYRLGGNYSKIANDVNPELDMTRTKFSASFQYKTKLLHTIIGHWQQDITDASASNYNSKDTVGATYQVTWPITNTLVNNSYIMVENHTYYDEHPLFKEVRDEVMTALSSQLLFNSSDKLQLKLSISVQNKESNVELFSYDRLEVAGSWQYRF